MSIKNVKEQIDFLLNKSIEDKNGLNLVVDYEQITNYYRSKIKSPTKDSNEVVLNVLESYPGSNIMISIEEISDDFDNRGITRTVIEELSEWSYIYGSKGKSVDNMEFPQFEDSDLSDQIKKRMNEAVKSSENLNPNDMALATELTGLIYSEYIKEDKDVDIFDSDTYIHIMNILEECESFIDMKKDGRLDWDMMGSTFKEISKYIQEDIMKNKGKESIIEELKEFEGDSIKDYVDQINQTVRFYSNQN